MAIDIIARGMIEETNGDVSQLSDEIEQNKIVFSKLDDFPAVGESNKIYIDTNTCKSYIFVNNTYQLVGDGDSTTDWGLIS